ncbi:MAG: hypothetical protein ACX94D_13765 [Henriciella sp.]|jgi:hypothetical protein
MADKTKTPERDARLKSALRDNLKRRKAAARKAPPAPKPDAPKS